MIGSATLKHTLYGDGINDDTAAIQELIGSGKEERVNKFN